MTHGLDDPSLGTVPQVAPRASSGVAGPVTSFVLECVEGSNVGQRFAIDGASPTRLALLYNAVARQLALGDLADPALAGMSALPRPPGEDDARIGAVPTDDIAQVLDLELGLLDARERVVRIFERRYLQRLLGRHGGNVARAAESAGIPRRHLHELLGRAQTDER